MYFAACFRFKEGCNNVAEDIKQRAIALKLESYTKKFDHIILKTQLQKDNSQSD